MLINIKQTRSICIVVVLTMFQCLSFGQRNIKELLSTSVKATPQMYDMYELNVKNYYKLKGRPEFDSELKTKVFMQSPEYNFMLNSLIQGRKDMFNYTYYIQENANIGDYILSCGCFGLNVGESFSGLKYLNQINYPLKRNILFFQDGLIQKGNVVYVHNNVSVAVDPLPIKTGQNGDEYLLIPVSEQTALKMEDLKNFDIYYFFNPKAYSKSTYMYTLKALVWSETRRETHRLFIADGLRVIIANSETGQIFYDKIYSANGSFSMKGNGNGIRIDRDGSNNISNMLLKSSEDSFIKVVSELDAIGWDLGNNRYENISTNETGQIVYQIKINQNGDIVSAKSLPQYQSVRQETEEQYRNQVLKFKLKPNAYVKPLDLSMGLLKITIDSN